VGISQAKTGLQADIQDAFESTIWTIPIKSTLIYPFFKTAALQVLREHEWNAFMQAHVIAVRNMRMQAKPHPRVTLALEGLNLIRGSEVLCTWLLQCEIDVPFHMVDAIYQSHPAATMNAQHFIKAKQDRSERPLVQFRCGARKGIGRWPLGFRTPR
jgi:hypothetical protein